jgi:hypothetical protein
VVRQAQVRFYFDADILGLAHVICGLRNDATYPGDPGAVIHKRHRQSCPITDKDDVDWIPKAAALGWLIISRDHNIRENPAERQAVRESGARMVALSGADAVNKWLQLELLMRRWRQIEALIEQPGPFIYLAQRARLVPLSLEDSQPPHGGRRMGQPDRRRARPAADDGQRVLHL